MNMGFIYYICGFATALVVGNVILIIDHIQQTRSIKNQKKKGLEDASDERPHDL